MQHKTDVDYKNGLKDIAKDLADLRYDSLRDFLEHFADKVEMDAVADHGRGRTKLSSSLHKTAKALEKAKDHMAEAWRLSKPYMKEDGSC